MSICYLIFLATKQSFHQFSWPWKINSLFCSQATLATTDNSCESVVTSGQHHLIPQHPPRDASPAGLVDNPSSCSIFGPNFCFYYFISIVAYGFVVLYIFQTFVHCRGDFNRVSFEGHRNCCRVGPNAWDEGCCHLYLSIF